MRLINLGSLWFLFNLNLSPNQLSSCSIPCCWGLREPTYLPTLLPKLRWRLTPLTLPSWERERRRSSIDGQN